MFSSVLYIRYISFSLLLLSLGCFVCLSDWRIHCATSYTKDGFWMYITQIATCSPWMFWMFLNSVFHFMWVAVLIMCQLYQVTDACYAYFLHHKFFIQIGWEV